MTFDRFGRSRIFGLGEAQDAPRAFQEAPKRPERGPKRPQNGPHEASKLPPRGPREAYHEIPTSTQEASDPQPRHGGGRGRRPVDAFVPR